MPNKTYAGIGSRRVQDIQAALDGARGSSGRVFNLEYVASVQHANRLLGKNIESAKKIVRKNLSEIQHAQLLDKIIEDIDALHTEKSRKAIIDRTVEIKTHSLFCPPIEK